MISREKALELAIERGLVPRGTTLAEAQQIARNRRSQPMSEFEKLNREVGGESSGDVQNFPAQRQSYDGSKESFLGGRLHALAQSSPVQGVLGAGDALRNTLADVGNLIPGTDIGKVKSGEGTAYNVGNILGNLGAFIGGGEGLMAARGAAEGLPLVGKLAKALGGEGKFNLGTKLGGKRTFSPENIQQNLGALSGLSRRAVGSAGYGALTNPEDRVGGAETGALLSGLIDIAPGATAGIKKGIEKVSHPFKPESQAKEIFDTIGGGKTLEENAKSLAEDIQHAYQRNKEQNNALYSGFNNFSHRLLTDGGVKDFNSAYNTLDKNIIADYLPDLKKLHAKYKETPTLQNAHDLQSDLGVEIRELEVQRKKGALSQLDKGKLQNYVAAQKAIQKDINTFLESENPTLAKQYQKASEHFRENVAPYRANPQIAEIISKKGANPKNITNIFKSPDLNIQKIAEDLGRKGHNKIIFSEIGKLAPNLNAKNLANALSKLETKNLGSYVSPEIDALKEQLEKTMGNRQFIQRLGGGLVGATLSGKNPIMSGLGALGGAAIAPLALKSSGAKLDSKSISALANALKRTYKPVTAKAIKANIIPEDKRKKLLELELTKYAGTQPREEY